MRFVLFVAIVLLSVPSKVHLRRRRSYCREVTLEEREELANMVFTGTVERLYRTRSDVYRGSVRIKRMIKGDDNLVENTVIVDGFGDPHICFSDVRERDTRIFMVSQLSNGYLRLNSSIIRVNIRTLNRAVSAAR
ncbi:agrin-like, partial [Limulus polyphemus]|uniref:Agrin-like n=1 Tax=Limulus polyphemus TaxID=6850 RepID=A0ABM1C498_LIMPO